MMTKSECQEMLDKGRFRTNLIGKKILKSHLELYELLDNYVEYGVLIESPIDDIEAQADAAYDRLTGKLERQNSIKTLTNVAYDCLSGKEENKRNE